MTRSSFLFDEEARPEHDDRHRQVRLPRVNIAASGSNWKDANTTIFGLGLSS